MEENGAKTRNDAGLKKAVRPQLDQRYASPLIDKIRRNGFLLEQGHLEIRLAREFGFCYGVERAVEYAYETRARFPDRRIFLTDEIIHNPRVNRELLEMGIQFLSGPSASGVGISELGPGDVVIMPAFGVPVGALKEFRDRGCVIVDTTCGSVMSVWKRVESYKKDGFTSVIHGKYDHEETRATCSRAGKYLVITDQNEARQVCEYIKGLVSRGSFLVRFKKVCAEDFDPDRDLERIGFANQTTMLMRESVGISDMLRDALKARYGEKEAKERFRHFDTICSATQDRQDAVRELGERNMDLILVIGGYKSSNTGHLAEIAAAYGPAFHIEDAACILSKEKISHRALDTGLITETGNWLVKRGQNKGDRQNDPVIQPALFKIGITAGASTPNLVIEEVIERLIRVV